MTNTKSLEEFKLVPHEIQQTYEIEPGSVEPLSGGIINQTYRVSSLGRPAILQRLGPVFDERLIEDFDVVTSHLQQKDWATPRPVPNRSGELSIRDNENKLWRAMSYVDSDPGANHELTDESLFQIGEMLANFHRTLDDLDYEPKYKIPHFHDTEHHVEKLRQIIDELPPRAVIMGEMALLAYTGLEPSEPSKEHLIHGDPRLGNMLFKDGKPLTFIDLDTVMKGTFWIDVGDMLRSFLGKLNQSGNNRLDQYRIADGYRSVLFPETDGTEFLHLAHLAQRKLQIELIARFLNDIVEDYYFDWDRGTYPSRKAHNMVRAAGQCALLN